MPRLPATTRGYNPDTDLFARDVSYYLMDQGYDPSLRFAILGVIAQAVRAIDKVVELEVDPEDRATVWRALATGIFALGGEPAALSLAKSPATSSYTDAEFDAIVKSIPFVGGAA